MAPRAYIGATRQYGRANLSTFGPNPTFTNGPRCCVAAHHSGRFIAELLGEVRRDVEAALPDNHRLALTWFRATIRAGWFGRKTSLANCPRCRSVAGVAVPMNLIACIHRLHYTKGSGVSSGSTIPKSSAEIAIPLSIKALYVAWVTGTPQISLSVGIVHFPNWIRAMYQSRILIAMRFRGVGCNAYNRALLLPPS